MVAKEEIAARIEEARRWVASGDELAVTVSDKVIAALAAERDRLATLVAGLITATADAVHRARYLGDGGAGLADRLEDAVARAKEGT